MEERKKLTPWPEINLEFTPVERNDKLRKKILLTVTEIILFSLVFSTVIYFFVRYEYGHTISWNDLKDWLRKDDLQPSWKFKPNCKIVMLNEEKFDCHPDSPASEEECLNRGCCWNDSVISEDIYSSNVPSCYFPSNYVGYEIKQVKKHPASISALLQRRIKSGFLLDVENINITVYFYDRDTVRIRMTDADNTRYEVPYPEQTRDLGGLYGKWGKPLYTKYSVFFRENGELLINRLSNRKTVFKTNVKRLIFSDQFLQLTSSLSSRYVYGLGQQKGPLLKNIDWNLITLFNRARDINSEQSSFGTHPFYLIMEKTGKSHGVLLLNSNAMDVLLQPTPAITFRPIGGIFDFFVFLGPRPDEVIRQYSKVIGTTFMPPYWSLGFHLSKHNYRNLEETINAWNRTRLAKIPFDTQWNDIDYMNDGEDFTYDKIRYEGLPKFVKQLHSIGMHYVSILDPSINNVEPSGKYSPYDDGLKMDIFIKNSSGHVLVGKVRNQKFKVFPDFLHPKIVDYWTKQLQNLHSRIEIDGILIDKNEPTNFYNGQDGCPNSTYERPRYLPKNLDSLNNYTLCMSSKHYNSLHYDVHNLYGFMEAIATNRSLTAITKKRPFVISRSSFPGMGRHAGVSDGNFNSSWKDMKLSISSILNFNMFGIPMVGVDICGFNGNTTVELCSRWSALGAFYPFSRNHNSDDTIEQDPAVLGPRVVTSAKRSLTTRYFFLPYLYTLFYKSYIFGQTVARPLFFEYPTDTKTYTIDEQFLWGKCLMIIPALYPNISKVNAYFPQDTWYDFRTSKEYDVTGIYLTVDVPDDEVNLAIRGGCIVPGQIPAGTTTESRMNDFYLIVALNDSKMAKGDLYWDDGEAIESPKLNNSFIRFRAENNNLVTHPVITNYDMPLLGFVKVLGCEERPKSVSVNENSTIFNYDADEKVLLISDLKLPLTQQNLISWIF